MTLAAAAVAILAPGSSWASTPEDPGGVALPAEDSYGLVVDSARGHLFVATGSGVLVTTTSGAVVTRIGTGRISDVTRAADGRVLASSLNGTSLEVIEPATLEVVLHLQLPPTQCPTSVASAGLRWIAYGYTCNAQWGGVGFVDLSDPHTPPRVFAGNDALYNPLVRSVPGTGTILATSVGSSPPDIALVDPVAGVVRRTRLEGCTNLRDLAPSPSGRTFVPACGAPYRFDAYRTSDFGFEKSFTANRHPVAATWSPQGGYFAGGVSSNYDDDVWLSRNDPGCTLVYSRDVTAGPSTRAPAPKGMGFSVDGRTLYVLAGDRFSGGVRLNALRGITDDVAPATEPLPDSPLPPVASTMKVDVTNELSVGGATMGVDATANAEETAAEASLGDRTVVTGRLVLADHMSARGLLVRLTRSVDGELVNDLTLSVDENGLFETVLIPSRSGLEMYNVYFAGDMPYQPSEAHAAQRNLGPLHFAA